MIWNIFKVENFQYKIIGKKFVEYRKKWDAVNRMEMITDFPMFLLIFPGWLGEDGAADRADRHDEPGKTGPASGSTGPFQTPFVS